MMCTVKTTIYMVRHCESEGNACRRSQARFDGIVTRKGLRQAEALAARFADVPVTAIYSSDAYRCRVTAEPLARIKKLPVQYRALLREYTIGAWEGMGIGYTACRFPDIYERWLTAPYDHNIPGADPFPLVAERGCIAIQQIAQENPGGSVVAFTHSCSLVCTLTKLLGQPISYYGSIKSGDNTAVTKLEVDEDGTVEVKYINDDSHLPTELLRHNYTGRSAATNFDFHPIGNPDTDIRFAAAANDMCREFPEWYAEEPLKAAVRRALDQNGGFAVTATLPDRVCGMVIVRRDETLPADHGMLATLYVVEDLRDRGYCEQAMGEAIDVLRRADCRYLVVEKADDPHLQQMLDRFCFEPMPGYDSQMRMALTVPGLEGPIY